MGQRVSNELLLASFKEYLIELEESGVEGLTLDPSIDELCGEAHKTPGTVSDPLASISNLKMLRNHIGDCRRCPLSATRTKLVFGTGNEKSRIVFVGDAPGGDEDRQGEPFVGEAGKILTRIIQAMGLSHQDVYICNLIKCRPPGNRNPHRDEVDACSGFLLAQLRIVVPEVVVALGTFATQTLLNSKEPISRMRGRFHDYHGIPLMPTFHPSFLLRNRDDKERYWDVWSDMEQVLIKLGLTVPDKKRGK